MGNINSCNINCNKETTEQDKQVFNFIDDNNSIDNIIKDINNKLKSYYKITNDKTALHE